MSCVFSSRKRYVTTMKAENILYTFRKMQKYRKIVTLLMKV